jgi:hypothetical protein
MEPSSQLPRKPHHPRTIPLWPDAAEILGISKSTAFAVLAPSGWLIKDRVPILRVGGRWHVPVAPLMKALYIDDEEDLRSRCFTTDPDQVAGS